MIRILENGNLMSADQILALDPTWIDLAIQEAQAAGGRLQTGNTVITIN